MPMPVQRYPLTPDAHSRLDTSSTNDVVADDGWQDIVQDFVQHVKQQQVTDDFLTAVAACGELLADNFPATDNNNNELPNHLV